MTETQWPFNKYNDLQAVLPWISKNIHMMAACVKAYRKRSSGKGGDSYADGEKIQRLAESEA